MVAKKSDITFYLTYEVHTSGGTFAGRRDDAALFATIDVLQADYGSFGIIKGQVVRHSHNSRTNETEKLTTVNFNSNSSWFSQGGGRRYKEDAPQRGGSRKQNREQKGTKDFVEGMGEAVFPGSKIRTFS